MNCINPPRFVIPHACCNISLNVRLQCRSLMSHPWHFPGYRTHLAPAKKNPSNSTWHFANTSSGCTKKNKKNILMKSSHREHALLQRDNETFSLQIPNRWRSALKSQIQPSIRHVLILATKCYLADKVLCLLTTKAKRTNQFNKHMLDVLNTFFFHKMWHILTIVIMNQKDMRFSYCISIKGQFSTTFSFWINFLNIHIWKWQNTLSEGSVCLWCRECRWENIQT